MVAIAHFYIRERVADYSKWRKVYDSLDDIKLPRGFIQSKVFQNTSDPSEVVILETWNSLANARAWSQSPEIHAAMKEAGVITTPVLLFLEEA